MATITVTVAPTSNSMQGQIVYTYTQNQSANTSTISASLQYKTNGPRTSYTGANVSNFYLTIDGSTVYKTDGATIPATNTWTEVLTHTKIVEHNADGTRTVTISAGGGIPATSGLPNSSGSEDVSLPQIPRGSFFGNISGSSIGTALTINIDVPTGVTNYHKITYSFVGKTTITGDVTTAPYTSDTSYSSWVPDYNVFGAAIPDRTSGTLTLTLTSYTDAAGTTQRGDPDTKTITLKMPNNASTRPTMGTASATDTTFARDGETKVVTLIGSYVQGVSKPRFTTTAATANAGASIASYSFEFEGTTKTGTELSQTFGVIQGTGSVRCVITATDSRGFTNTRNRDITVLAYTFPAITAQRIKRTATDTVTATASATTTDLGDNKNALQIFASYKLPSESYYHNETELTGGTTTRADGVKTLTNASAVLSNIDDSLSYNFKITVKDSLTTYSQEYKVGTSAVGLHIGPTWIGVGKIHERGALDVGGSIFANPSIVVTDVAKTDVNDGLRGTLISRLGRIYIQGDSSNAPQINFYGKSGSTTRTAAIEENTDGILSSIGNFMAPNLPSIESLYLSTSGSESFTLTARHTYLLICTRHGTANEEAEFRVIAVGASSIIGNAQISGASFISSVSASGTTLSVTTNKAYIRITLLDLGSYS